MNEDANTRAATVIWTTWSEGRRIASLPEDCRPSTMEEAYAAQAQIADVADACVVGWKIAATSAAGQRHIGVDGPLAGRLLVPRVFTSPARIPFGANHMRVAEAEFAFVLATELPPRGEPYDEPEVMAAVASLHPAIEIPDSRFEAFATAGGPQLVADNACAHWFVLGEPTNGEWRTADLARHEVTLKINGTVASRGHGADVLGDPRTALTWIVNQQSILGERLRAGQFITTGVCGKPSPIAPGDRVSAQFGAFGQADLVLSDG